MMPNPPQNHSHSNQSVSNVLDMAFVKPFHNKREEQEPLSWVETEFVTDVNHKVMGSLLAARNALYLIADRYKDPNLLKSLDLIEMELANISRVLGQARFEAGQRALREHRREKTSLEALG